MTLKNDALQAIGELFIMGFNGLELEESTARFISEAGIGGVILFGHNYESPGQTAELSNQIQECRRELPLWVSVDHEGGRVQRFKKGFTRIPDAATIGALDSPRTAFEIAEMMAKELRAVGININFCPIVDINTNPKNPVIGNRAYGTTEEAVTKISTAVVRGLLVGGVLPCVKHFPGHGDTHTDSHFSLPSVDTSIEVLREREFKPFVKAFKSRCPLVMTAHVMIPSLDPKYPATLSHTILQGILRDQLRFSKVIVSDDMEMKAIADHFGAEDAPRLALEAGCDLLIYRTEAATQLAYEALVKAVDSGQLAPETVLRAAKRSRSLKQEAIFPYHEIPISELARKVGTPEHYAIIDKATSPLVKPRR